MDAIVWTKEEFKNKLLDLGCRYHIHHPFQKAMNEGKLNEYQIKGWVANRFYYQINIPRKDAAILTNCDDKLFRQRWIKRIIDHDGTETDEGGIEAWLRLATACGLTREDTLSLKKVAPGVRFAVDTYLQFAKQSPWEEAVCCCLTELFARKIHQIRVDTWPKHYPWIQSDGLTYFKNRISKLQSEAEYALEFTLNNCNTKQKQLRALDILNFKLDILWSMLDAISLAYGFIIQPKINLAARFKLRWEEVQNSFVLLYPEGLIKLNQSSSEILNLCNGTNTQDEIIMALENKFANDNIKKDVIEFLEQAHTNGWICHQ